MDLVSRLEKIGACIISVGFRLCLAFGLYTQEDVQHGDGVVRRP